MLICLSALESDAVAGVNPIKQLAELERSALYFATKQGEPIVELRPDTLLVPASTLKLLTAFAALETWGSGYRFHTDFLMGEDGQLVIKGYGDPMLVSEEWDLIVQQLYRKGVSAIRGIRTEHAFFSPTLNINGRSSTDNPYDAAPGALGCNFNTIFVRKDASGVLRSAETQTPLTATSRRLARDLPPGRHRINLGQADNGATYCRELFAAKLQQAGISVAQSEAQSEAPAPVESLRLVYRHYNTRTLAEVVAAMLRYSNNFIANQLYLLLGAHRFQAPATVEKSQKAMAAFVGEHFDWDDYRLLEGSGLSRANRLSARQLVDVLEQLKPFAHLLPEKDSRIVAKTGTLQGVSSYAGFVRTSDGLSPFALIINESVDPGFRYQLADALAERVSP